MDEDTTRARPALLRRWDILLIAAALVCALLFCWARQPKQQEEPLTAVVEHDGSVLARVPLRRGKCEISVPGEYPAVVRIETDGASVVSASCPDQRCVQAGKLTRAGQVAICLPDRLTLRLEGGEREVDGYTG